MIRRFYDAWVRRRMLSRASLDPDTLRRPLAGAGPRDFVICGAPRSGTTLLAAALFQPPTIATLVEPPDGLCLEPAVLFGRIRHELARTRKLHENGMDCRALMERRAVEWATGPSRPTTIPYTEATWIGVKWPGFWRYLGLLPKTKFLVCVRDPREVIGSYEQRGDNLHLGLEYEVPFHARMNAELKRATDDVHVRRVLLYDYVYKHALGFASDPMVMLVRYERWFEEPRMLCAEIERFLEVELDCERLPIVKRSNVLPASARQCKAIQKFCSTALPLGYPFGRRLRSKA